MGRTIAPTLQRMIAGASAMAPMAAVNAVKTGEDKGLAAGVESFAEDEAISAAFGPVGPGEAALKISGEQVPSAFKTMGVHVLAHAGLNAGQNISLDLAHRINSYADGSDPKALDPGELLPALASDGLLGAGVGALFAVPEGRSRARAMDAIGTEKIASATAAVANEQDLLHLASVAHETQMATAAPGEAGELLRQMNQKPDLVVDVAAWHDRAVKAGEDPKEVAEKFMGPGAYDNISGGQLTIPHSVFTIAMDADPEMQKWVAHEARPTPDAPNSREGTATLKPVVEAKPSEDAEPENGGDTSFNFGANATDDRTYEHPGERPWDIIDDIGRIGSLKAKPVGETGGMAPSYHAACPLMRLHNAFMMMD